MKFTKPLILFFTIISILPVHQLKALSHSGGTNSRGCHKRRRTGGYHCHGSGTGITNFRQIYPKPDKNRENYYRNNPVNLSNGCSIAHRTPTDAVNIFSDHFFHSLNPDMKGLSITSDQTNLKREWIAIHDFVSKNIIYNLPVGSFVGSKSDLSDVVFYTRHPERKGRKIESHENVLKGEWLSILNRLNCHIVY